jgi:hypothetical protein
MPNINGQGDPVSVLFSGKILPFFDKEIGKILEMIFPSVNSTNLANFIVKFRQNSDTEIMKKNSLDPAPTPHLQLLVRPLRANN